MKINMKITNTKEFNEAAKEMLPDCIDELKKLAAEYHIDPQDTEDYINGDMQELATPLQLAIGTIEDAKTTLNTDGVLADWMGTLETMAATSEELAEKITFSGLEIKDLLGQILKKAFDSKIQVDDRIVKAAGLQTPLYLGIPGNKEIKKLIEDFYA